MKRTHYRKLILKEYTEMLILDGYSIMDILGKRLSEFNYDGMVEVIIKHKKLEDSKESIKQLKDLANKAR